MNNMPSATSTTTSPVAPNGNFGTAVQPPIATGPAARSPIPNYDAAQTMVLSQEGIALFNEEEQDVYYHHRICFYANIEQRFASAATASPSTSQPPHQRSTADHEHSANTTRAARAPVWKFRADRDRNAAGLERRGLLPERSLEYLAPKLRPSHLCTSHWQHVHDNRHDDLLRPGWCTVHHNVVCSGPSFHAFAYGDAHERFYGHRRWSHTHESWRSGCSSFRGGARLSGAFWSVDEAIKHTPLFAGILIKPIRTIGATRFSGYVRHPRSPQMQYEADGLASLEIADRALLARVKAALLRQTCASASGSGQQQQAVPTSEPSRVRRVSSVQ